MRAAEASATFAETGATSAEARTPSTEAGAPIAEARAHCPELAVGRSVAAERCIAVARVIHAMTDVIVQRESRRDGDLVLNLFDALHLARLALSVFLERVREHVSCEGHDPVAVDVEREEIEHAVVRQREE